MLFAHSKRERRTKTQYQKAPEDWRSPKTLAGPSRGASFRRGASLDCGSPLPLFEKSQRKPSIQTVSAGRFPRTSSFDSRANFENDQCKRLPVMKNLTFALTCRLFQIPPCPTCVNRSRGAADRTDVQVVTELKGDRTSDRARFIGRQPARPLLPRRAASKLPIGSHRPRKGGLRNQLKAGSGWNDRSAAGNFRSGCKFEGNAWASPDRPGGTAAGKNLPYWLKGYGAILATFLRDGENHSRSAPLDRWACLSSQEADGWFGPARAPQDVAQRQTRIFGRTMVMLNVLQIVL